MAIDAKILKQLPVWKCHKKVKAAKIVGMTTLTVNVVLELENVDIFFIPKVAMESKPTPEIGWYYVEYEDGYFSFSPPKQFEEGYTLES